ncbi:MAG: hypothetical protein AAFV07_18665 [Bacteroidota bacterium]
MAKGIYLMDSKIISEAQKPDILALLHKGEFDLVLPKIKQKKKVLFDLFSQSKAETSFAYSILYACLRKTIKPTEYSRAAKLTFADDYLLELIELHRILLVLEDYGNAVEIEKLVALTLLECIRDSAVHIQQNANNYPQTSIGAGIWMDGAGLRLRAHELATYFQNKEDAPNTLEAIFLKAKLTNTIMSHYPHLVGPDMIAVAHQLEKMGNKERAKQFFTPVALDFTGLVHDVESGLDDNDSRDEDIQVTESLIQALEGLKRLGESVNEESLQHAKEILMELEKAGGES